MRVAELMTKDPVTVQGETSLADVAGLMDRHHINGLPVVDGANTLIGIITQGDLLRRAELGTDQRPTNWLTSFLLPSRSENDYVRTHGRHVREVMTADPHAVSPDSELVLAAMLMTQKHLKCLPVVSGHVLVGVISRSDLIRAFAAMPIDTAGASDGMIRQAILDKMAHELWAPRTGIRVAVKAGIVNLEGVIFRDSERRAVTVIAENVPGVKQVNDHLVYVDPGSGMAFPETM